MSDISERPGALDLGYEAPIRYFEVERPAAGATGTADLADVTAYQPKWQHTYPRAYSTR